MISQSSNRVKAIKSRFENLNEESRKHEKLTRKQTEPLLNQRERTYYHHKIKENADRKIPFRSTANDDSTKCNDKSVKEDVSHSSESDEERVIPKANNSYLYNKICNANRSLSRQSSDPGKKLHRSHAFRCDRSQKISPKRHSSCNGRAEMNETPTLKIGDKPRLSRDRLKRLGHLLEDRMRKENYVPLGTYENDIPLDHNAFEIVAKSESPSKTEEFQTSLPDEKVPQHILDQYAKVLKPKKKLSPESPTEVLLRHELMTDSGVSSETENGQETEAFEKSGRLKKLRAHFESNNVILNKTEDKTAQSQDEPVKTSDNKENVLTKTNLRVDSEIYASTETIRRIERKNPNIILTDTLKKALKQPLPPGPPPKKPPRTFANVSGESAPNSPEFSPKPERKTSVESIDSQKLKKDPKRMLEKLEKALQKHNESKVIIPRQTHNIYDIAEADTSDPKLITDETGSKNVKRKEIHYLCTEILDIAQRSLLPNSNCDSTMSNSISNCFNSLNCGIVPTRSSSSIAYAKLNGSGPNSSRSSLSNICCACNGDSIENLNDLSDSRSKFSTFFSNKSDDSLCKKCGINIQKDEAFRCHLSCKCKDKAEPKSTFFVTNDTEHIYEEPYQYNGTQRSGSKGSEWVKKSITPRGDITAEESGGLVKNILRRLESGERVNDGETSYGVLNSKLRRSEEDLRGVGSEDQKIYDVPCDPSRSPTPEIVASSPKAPHSFESLRRGFENCSPEHAKPLPIKSRSLDIPDLLKHEGPKSLDLKTHPDIAAKPLNVVNKAKLKLGPSKSSENLAKDFGLVKKSLEKKFGTEGAKRQRRFERNSPPNNGTTVLAVQKKCSDRKKDQLDVDRENLNKLMNEIYETVSAHCDMETVSRFPVDTDCSSSEDSIKLSRSLTEKRKNYVRRVSSRVAYLEPQTRQNVRFRHQTSICSYKSDNLQAHNTYATFRSWKSFKNSQILSKSNNSLKNAYEDINVKDDTKVTNSNDSKLAGRDSIDGVDSFTKRDSVDSKANLTDSRGNLLRDDFDSDLDQAYDSVDDKAGCLDIDRPLEAREKGLFDVCLLVGLNHMTGQAYVKSVFPKDVTVPPHIENLVFPETISADEIADSVSRPEYDLDAANTQCYSLVLTNEKGERSFGYCRRVLPEGATFCLPLSYCLISRFRAPGFYYKVLQELESHHGSSDQILDSFLQQLFEKDFPNPGESITLTQIRTPKKTIDDLRKSSVYRNSVNLGDILKCKTLEPKKSPKSDYASSEALVERKANSEIPEYYDLENNNRPKLSLPDDDTISKVIKRPIEPRMDDDNLSVLFDSISVGLLIKIFGTLLLERKVVLISDKLSQLSSCIEALQAIMYPLVWQQPLVSTIPAELRRDILEAPLPILAGLMRGRGGGGDEWEARLQQIQFEEGMLIDLSPKLGAKIIFDQGDESTIIPGGCQKTLKSSLQLESSKNLVGTEKEVEKARNVLIAEAFLRFFVDVMADFWHYFKYGKRKREDWEEGPVSDEDVVLFDKELFVKSAQTKQIQYFLEWFTETAMFNHFIQNMAVCYPTHREMAPLDFANIVGLVDTPTPNYYEVFDERITRRHLATGGAKKSVKSAETPSRCVKSAVNKKVKLLKNKLRDLVN